MIENKADHKKERLIRLDEVIHRVGLKKTAIYDGMKNGTFPKCRKRGRDSLWLESDIDLYVDCIKTGTQYMQSAANDDHAESAA